MSSWESKSWFPFPSLEQIYKEEHGGGHNLDLSMSLVMLLGASDQVWWVYIRFFSIVLALLVYTALQTLLLLTALYKYVQPSPREGLTKSGSAISPQKKKKCGRATKIGLFEQKQNHSIHVSIVIAYFSHWHITRQNKRTNVDAFPSIKDS